LNKLLKYNLKRTLAKFGFEIRRIRRTQDRKMVYGNPKEALLCGSDLVEVNIEDCVDKLGFNYGRWQPWKAAAEQLIANPDLTRFESSILSDFYKKWSFPLIAKVFSEKIEDEKIRNHLLKVFHGNFMPFCNHSESDINSLVTNWTTYIESDNINSGHDLTLDQSINQDGTWTRAKGEIELKRLSRLISSVRQHGYQRNDSADGNILAYALEKGQRTQYLVVSGLHRMAVLAALGNKKVIIRLTVATIVHNRSVDIWPLVKSNVYTKDDALSYFNHLFNFDTSPWDNLGFHRLDLNMKKNSNERKNS
jgi:hypothetical protein